ncbi:hypothetical protein [Pseudarthrobacter sulfonivorans]|uniref:hypothetical protein n=1 Tax=Pseudarthrobacter sulfonivorans TaxID=121292 RepID=UPI0027E3117E|nr:hypothetical protein [Pseudarthrobacter sulfonivorans]
MNRLRAAYLELDPDIGKFLMASPHDDLAGLLASVLGTGTGIAAALAATAGLVFLAGSSIHGYKSYAGFWRDYTPVSPSPTDPLPPRNAR